MAVGRKTGGRQKGVPNKLTGELKEMILEAANQAHPDGAIAYLKARSADQPVAFMSLLGRVLPLQVGGDKDNPLTVRNIIEQHIVDPKS